MKVTALIPDELVEEVSHHAKGKTLTESLVIVLKEWVALRKIAGLNKKIEQKPLQFEKGFSASKARALNRKS